MQADVMTPALTALSRAEPDATSPPAHQPSVGLSTLSVGPSIRSVGPSNVLLDYLTASQIAGVRGDGAGGRDDAGADGALALAARRTAPRSAPGPQGHSHSNLPCTCTAKAFPGDPESGAHNLLVAPHLVAPQAPKVTMCFLNALDLC